MKAFIHWANNYYIPYQMQTEDLVKRVLDQWFNGYKEFQIIFLIAFALIQLIFTYLMFKKTEKFKALLKRSEIKFSRYHEMQVEALRVNYQKLAIFHAYNTDLFNGDYNSNNHKRYEKRIAEWLKAYRDCINQLAIDKILLPQNLINLINQTLDDFKKVQKILRKEKENLEYVEMEGMGNWDFIYEYNENELSIINSKITKLKSEDYIINSDKNIRRLRESIEEHFSKMNE